jgi:16S rRNA (cytosine967-C5)-methyltransferase
VDANVMRLGLRSLRTRALAEDELPLSADEGPVDAALVDAPCSNTGVVARRPEARLGLTTRKLRSLVRVQETLLRRAGEMVREGGRLIYSTCSLELEENERVVEAFCAQSPGWSLVGEATLLPSWGPRLSDWRDGGYVARLVRTR